VNHNSKVSNRISITNFILLGKTVENRFNAGFINNSTNISQLSHEPNRKNLKSVTTTRKKANPKILLDKIPKRTRLPSEGVESFNEDAEIIDLKIKMPRLDLEAIANQ